VAGDGGCRRHRPIFFPVNTNATPVSFSLPAEIRRGPRGMRDVTQPLEMVARNN
jgi:hypothetical protein